MRYKFSVSLVFWFACFWVSPIGLCEQSTQNHRVLTSLSVVGDDQLTQNFASVLNEEISRSDYFILAAHADWAIEMSIPAPLYWQSRGDRTNFQYVVIFTDRQSKYLGVSLGPCWADEMKTCAKKVLIDARSALNH